VDLLLAAKLHLRRSRGLPTAAVGAQEASARGCRRTLTPTEADMVTGRSGAGTGDYGALTCPMAGNWSLRRRCTASRGPDGCDGGVGADGDGEGVELRS
jgi:hypothetical protein